MTQVARVAPSETTVLVTGESGTGKEIVARLLRQGSPRAAKPFVAVNCAALPEPLLESELFGHERGAFTGAVARKIGRLEQAAGGTLFLDEITEMTPVLQAKFLRVLQEREFQRVGGTQVLKTDVRVLAATNRDLGAAIAHGQFREDLYYRLNVFEIHIPALRDRRDDILPLAERLEELSQAMGRPATGISRDAREWLRRIQARNVRAAQRHRARDPVCDGALIAREHRLQRSHGRRQRAGVNGGRPRTYARGRTGSGGLSGASSSAPCGLAGQQGEGREAARPHPCSAVHTDREVRAGFAAGTWAIRSLRTPDSRFGAQARSARTSSLSRQQALIFPPC